MEVTFIREWKGMFLPGRVVKTERYPEFSLSGRMFQMYGWNYFIGVEFNSLPTVPEKIMEESEIIDWSL